MSYEIQDQVKDGIRRYSALVSSGADGSCVAECRNAIYSLMSDFMMIWVTTILARWKRFESYQERLSASWDAFCFCLDRYRNYDIPVPKHFYDYSRYFLLSHYAKKDHVFLPIEDLQNTLALSELAETAPFENLLSLYQFREAMPELYKIVWDDALLSLCSRNDRQVTARPGLNTNAYFHVKKGFKAVICSVLGVSGVTR
jgi:hypothetical protein